MALRELALFAGAGGGILGSILLGWRTVCAVEIDPYCQRVLLQRQIDGCLEPFPIWDDIRTFNGQPWRGCVDIVTGGFPCTDISCAGKGAGINGDQSKLWFEMARIIGEVRPGFVIVENSSLLIHRGLAVVLADLAEVGFDAQWCRISAPECGAPIKKRDRLWLVAWPKSVSERSGFCASESADEWRGRSGDCGCEVAVSDSRGCESGGQSESGRLESSRRYVTYRRGEWVSRKTDWPAEPDVGRVAHGVAHRMDRLRAVGNGQVPRVAALAWEILGDHQ